MKTIKIKEKDYTIKFTNQTLSDFCDIQGSLELIEFKLIKGNKFKLIKDLLWSGIKNMNHSVKQEELWQLIEDYGSIDELGELLIEEVKEAGFIKSSFEDKKSEQTKLTPEELSIAQNLLI